MKGKIPPQAVEMEALVLGTMLQYRDAVYDICDILFPEAFYEEKNQLIFKAIHSLFLNGDPIDLITVSNTLKKTKELGRVGGDHYLIGIAQKVASSAQVEYHARIVLQKYIAREIIKMHSKGLGDAYEQDIDVFDLLDRAYSGIASVTEKTIQPTEVPFSKTLIEEVRTARRVYDKEIDPGILSHIENLNNISGGFRDTELIIVAARPGMGKTALALNFAKHSALSGSPVLVFSLEMSRAQLVKRVAASETKLHGDKWTKYGLSANEEKEVWKHKESWERINSNLHIDDTSSISIEKLRVKAKIASRKHGIKLIIVDYLQLMSGNARSNRNREQEISSISRGLKQVAKDINIPVIALSQLSRAVETRGGSKRPGLADLRESGAIEQDADMVMFLYRPEYYKIDEWDDDNRGPTAGQAEWIIKKNRNGALGEGRMQFQPEYSLFNDLDGGLFEDVPVLNIHHNEPRNYDDIDDSPF